MLDSKISELRNLDADRYDSGEPDEYFYRVDTLRGYRSIRLQGLLRPKRWDLHDRFPHVNLLAADKEKQEGQAIYRLSFWRTLDAAMRDVQLRGRDRAAVLVRVHRQNVRAAMAGWTFDEDDHAENAELIWRVGSCSEEVDGFHESGVPLSQLDVLDLVTDRWVQWRDSSAVVSDHIRFASIGWQPVAIRTRQGGPGMAYWLAVPRDCSKSTRRRFWCLLSLDEDVAGSLGGEEAAVARVLSQLVEGPLQEIRGALEGVLTLTPDSDRVWTEQFRASWIPGDGRWPRFLYGDPPPKMILKVGTYLTKCEVVDMIEASGLAKARSEYLRTIWQQIS